MAVADDFRFDYTSEYFLNTYPDADAHVVYDITLTKKNVRATIDKYSLAFPNIFAIHNLKLNDEAGPIAPILDNSKGFVNVTAFFNNPTNIDIDTHVLHFEFDQEHIASLSGRTVEVQIPIIIRQNTTGSYKVILHPPKQYHKFIRASVRPNLVSENIVIWLHPTKALLTSTFQPPKTLESPIPKTAPLFSTVSLWLWVSFGLAVGLIVIITLYASRHKKHS